VVPSMPSTSTGNMALFGVVVPTTGRIMGLDGKGWAAAIIY